VPLIIHLPPRSGSWPLATKGSHFPPTSRQAQHRWAQTDQSRRNVGHPLFTERPESRAISPRATIASSYGAVYGIGDGKSLFVSDAVSYKDYLFDMTTNDTGGSTANSSTKAKNEEKIRKGILAINHFYKYHGADK
jgi:hypothetical protein